MSSVDPAAFLETVLRLGTAFVLDALIGSNGKSGGQTDVERTPRDAQAKVAPARRAALRPPEAFHLVTSAVPSVCARWTTGGHVCEKGPVAANHLPRTPATRGRTMNARRSLRA